MSDQMKGKYCIFYEEYGEGGDLVRGKLACEGNAKSMDPPWGGGGKTVNKVVVEKEDQSWNVSAVRKKKRDGVGWGGVGGREGGGSPSALLHGDRLSTTPKKSAVAIRALMKM